MNQKLLKNTPQSNSNQLQELNDVKDDVEMIEIPKSNLSDNQIDENIFLDNNKISDKEITLNEILYKSDAVNMNDIYVNKIIIAKNIDNDNTSDNYRNPIDAYKTISTLDESIIKEVNYHPSFLYGQVLILRKKHLINLANSNH